MDLTRHYFDLLGLPVDYSVDREKLSVNYRQLQQQFHPDRFVSAADQERRFSLQMASRINEGNRVLRDPIERAKYLLELQGGEMGTDGETLRDPQFLLEQMELRENLEEIQQDIEGLERFVEQIEQQIRQQGERFSTQWQESPEQARTTVQQMQFFQRLIHQAELLLDELI